MAKEEPMRRVRYSVAMSLDGYIAGPQGESDWIVMDPELDFSALFAAFDTVLLGRITYEATRQPGSEGPAMPGMQSYVFSRTLRPEDCPGVILSDDPKRIVSDLDLERLGCCSGCHAHHARGNRGRIRSSIAATLRNHVADIDAPPPVARDAASSP